MPNKIEELKKQYESIQIPENLTEQIEQSLHIPKPKEKTFPILIGLVAVAILLVTISLNTSVTMAKALYDVPVLGKVVKVLTFTKYEFTKDEYLSKIDSYIFSTLAKSPEYITMFQTQLNNLGYHLAINGVMDRTTKLTIEAFQYHFRPSLCNGEMDAESWAILQALVKKYPR